jgi:5-(carboxyamino)imidazole ribonucleotide synthase
VHVDGILDHHRPRGDPGVSGTDAVLIASRILNALDYVGVMGVELFVRLRA